MCAKKIPESAKKLIQGKNFGSIATLMPDGSPHVTPVWIDLEDDTILVNTAEGRLKHKNLSKNPLVALSVFDQNNPYTMVAIRGRVREMTRNGAEEHIDKLAKKYLGQEKYPFRQPGQKRVLIRIEPIHIAAQ